MKILLTITVYLGFLFLGSNIALACLCRPESLGHAIKRLRKEATVIFVGKAKEVTKEARGYKATFDVGRSWKGDEVQEITIYTEGGCMAWFEVGRTYIVYARPNSGNRLSTDVCMRTGLIKYAEEDLKRLGKPQFTSDVSSAKTN